MWPFSYGGYFFPTFAYFCLLFTKIKVVYTQAYLLLLTFERQQKAGKRQEKEQPQKKKEQPQKEKNRKRTGKKRPGPLKMTRQDKTSVD